MLGLPGASVEICDALGVLGAGGVLVGWVEYFANIAARRALRSASNCSVDGGDTTVKSNSGSGWSTCTGAGAGAGAGTETEIAGRAGEFGTVSTVARWERGAGVDARLA